eukprot:6184939-Pleurochrysis_carterae.AAC.1
MNLSYRRTPTQIVSNFVACVWQTDLKVALIGSQAKQPLVHGGGSGEVKPAYTSAPYEAIRQVLKIEGDVLCSGNSCAYYDDGSN